MRSLVISTWALALLFVGCTENEPPGAPRIQLKPEAPTTVDDLLVTIVKDDMKS